MTEGSPQLQLVGGSVQAAADGSGVISGLAGIGWGSIPALLFGDAGEDFLNSFAKIDRDRLLGGKGGTSSNLKWGNPKSKPTYGHTFVQHGQKQTSTQLADRARSLKHQIGQWLDDQKAADFLADVAKRGEGVYDIELPVGIQGRSFLPDGTEVTTNMARVIVKSDGSIKTAFPYNSLFD
ncbi:MAG: hypothetical protein OSJ61_27845 [Lachnospiraceae bacterium]|nr:hypothetical protein [Lachnospiraceae bacterium]